MLLLLLLLEPLIMVNEISFCTMLSLLRIREPWTPLPLLKLYCQYLYYTITTTTTTTSMLLLLSPCLCLFSQTLSFFNMSSTSSIQWWWFKYSSFSPLFTIYVYIYGHLRRPLRLNAVIIVIIIIIIILTVILSLSGLAKSYYHLHPTTTSSSNTAISTDFTMIATRIKSEREGEKELLLSIK